jgi:ABC-type sugar transport system substrate-binding protein
MGATAVEVAVKLANGEQVPRFNTVPVTYVTKANVDQFVERYPK